MKTSPLAPQNIPRLPAMDGVKMATTAAGIKYAGRTDLLLMVFDAPAIAAGVFTKSRCPSAPVDWCRALLSADNPSARAMVVNAGNANAFTGRKGNEATKMTALAASGAVGCAEEDVYLASTGVIGEPLDGSIFANALKKLSGEVQSDGWHGAAEAIMTTDTYPKVATASFDLEGTKVTINGIAKGSGMIAPDMATMLSFLVTDMPMAQPLLQAALSEKVGGTFNAITVDSDTSTSDTVMLFSTQNAGVAPLESADDPRYSSFKEKLGEVLHELAMQVVRDGEGASKLVEVRVGGAESDVSAKCVALSIANSPLVKTAVAGEDANWGRVVMAVGKAGEPADRDKLEIAFGHWNGADEKIVTVAVNGERQPGYSEDDASAVMRSDEIIIAVNLNIGDGVASVWTCDLTKEYVAINGDYRS